MSSMHCRACNGRLMDFASRGGFQIYKCEDCGFGQTNVTPEDIRHFYEKDYFDGKVARFSQADTEKADFAKAWWIDRSVRPGDVDCLEVGPGPAGMVAEYLRETRPAVKYEAVEVSEDASGVLRGRGFSVHTGKVYDSAIKSALHQKFDCVIATEVIEHDLDPESFIRGMYDALKQGGRACLTTGNFDGLTARVTGRNWYYLDPPAHVVFYTPRSVEKLFLGAGFSGVSVQCVGLNYVRLHRKLPVPGLLKLIHALQVPTGMTICAVK